jgi:hypothetical protein
MVHGQKPGMNRNYITATKARRHKENHNSVKSLYLSFIRALVALDKKLLLSVIKSYF